MNNQKAELIYDDKEETKEELEQMEYFDKVDLEEEFDLSNIKSKIVKINNKRITMLIPNKIFQNALKVARETGTGYQNALKTAMAIGLKELLKQLSPPHSAGQK
jgi:hypothetical protein